MKNKRFKITYIDNMSRGNKNETYYEGSPETTKEQVIKFFGLREPDVTYFKVEEITNQSNTQDNED